MELTDSLKALFRETATTLKGSARRLFMARTVKELGPGGQRRAERELGWNRETIRKGLHELERGVICLDNFAARGRKRVEDHLPPCSRISPPWSIARAKPIPSFVPSGFTPDWMRPKCAAN